MTNAEAINELQSAIDLIKQDGKDWLDERDIPILEMAIKALEAQDVPDTNVGDTISRQAAIDAAIDAADDWDGCTNIGRQKRIENYINKLPPAQPELKTVKCIIGGGYMDIGDADFSMKCAKCGAEYYHVEAYDYDYNFCPNCGRRWRRQDG